MADKPLVTRERDILGGTPVFTGTRVPVQTLLDYLVAGDTLDAFLDDFPTVSRAHVLAVLGKRFILIIPFLSLARRSLPHQKASKQLANGWSGWIRISASLRAYYNKKKSLQVLSFFSR